MRAIASSRRAALLATAVLLAPFCHAQDQNLSIKPGTYVQESAQCDGAPNAAILAWDGAAFSSAHTGKCTSTVLHRDANNFVVSTSCSALGDGSPNPSAKAFNETFVLTQLADTRFTVTKRNQLPANYRWCSARPPQ